MLRTSCASASRGIAQAAGVDFETLDIHVITAPVLRLDRSEDQQALRATVACLQPKLSILDPFVPLHAIDENAAAEVAPLLAYLRSLQRHFHTAVALVHHARKGAAHERGGQALRGSSELHAWGDSNLYLRRNGEKLFLNIEHRAAPKHRSPATRSQDQLTCACSRGRRAIANPRRRIRPRSNRPLCSASSRSWRKPGRPLHNGNCAMPHACAPATSLPSLLNWWPAAAPLS
jgi:hypothetical protein